jgi:hypothetical protein
LATEKSILRGGKLCQAAKRAGEGFEGQPPCTGPAAPEKFCPKSDKRDEKQTNIALISGVSTPLFDKRGRFWRKDLAAPSLFAGTK